MLKTREENHSLQDYTLTFVMFITEKFLVHKLFFVLLIVLKKSCNQQYCLRHCDEVWPSSSSVSALHKKTCRKVWTKIQQTEMSDKMMLGIMYD